MKTITPEQMQAHVTPEREEQKKRRKMAEILKSNCSPILLPPSILVVPRYLFGKYNGQPIRWDAIGSKPDQVLAITDDIDVKDIAGTEDLIKDWSGSEIRQWLNGTFFNTAFSALEQAQILTTKVETSYKDNPESKVETEDKIFLLSSSEIKDEGRSKLAIENTLLRDSCGHAGKIRPAMWINLNGIDKVWEDREQRTKPLQERLKFFGCNNQQDVPIPQTWKVIDVSENTATIFPLTDYVNRVRNIIYRFRPYPAFEGISNSIKFSSEESEKIVFKKEGVDGYIQIKIDSDLDRLVETRVKESERFIIDEEPELQIIFGKFDDCGSGEAKPVEWNVLYKDGNKALVYANLVAMSSKWLNDVFYNTAFSDEEKNKIVPNSNGDSMFLLGKTREILPIYAVEQIKTKPFYSADFTPAMWVKIDSDVIMQEKTKDEKGRTPLTPEQMQAKLEAEKRRRELAYRLKESGGEK